MVASDFPIWPLFALAGVMTLTAGGIFLAIWWGARKEKDGDADTP